MFYAVKLYPLHEPILNRTTNAERVVMPSMLRPSATLVPRVGKTKNFLPFKKTAGVQGVRSEYLELRKTF